MGLSLTTARAGNRAESNLKIFVVDGVRSNRRTASQSAARLSVTFPGHSTTNTTHPCVAGSHPADMLQRGLCCYRLEKRTPAVR